MKTRTKLDALLRRPKVPLTSVPMSRPVFYVKTEVYQAFKAACERRGHPMSHVIEAFMADLAAGKYDSKD